MTLLTLDNLVEQLVRQFPEFKNYKDFSLWNYEDSEECNALVWVFGDFVADHLKNISVPDELSKRLFVFLNEQFNKEESDKEALDYLGTEIFEAIATSRKAINIARKYLKDKALDSLNETLKWYQPLSEDT